MFHKAFRSALSLLLAFCLLLGIGANGLVIAVDMSTRTDSNVIDYVSLGASNTNGYGHRGYLPAEVTEDPLAASKANLNTYGYERAPQNAYPAQIAAALEALTGQEVELHQLAISSMRTEEVSILLDDSWDGDAYTEWRFTGGQKWFEIALPGGIDALRAAYRDAITDAEVITVDVGWNNFGVYAFNNVKSILSNGTYWKAPEWDALLDKSEQEYYETIKAFALDYLTSEAEMDDPALAEKFDMIADVLAYATMGACYHFDVIMGKIYELNPNATVVAINIQNLADGLVVEFEGKTIELGDLYGDLIKMVDLYRASECPYADRFYFADAGDVSTYLDEIVSWDGDPTTLTDDMKDCFDMYDDSLYVRSIVEYMMVGQALSGVFKSVRDMAAANGLSIFADDEFYTYVFALDMAWLEGVDLSKLDLQNPDTDLERYGAALSKHLVNLRAQNYDAYDYAFAAVIEGLEAQKANVEAQKAAAEAQLAQATDPAVIASLVAAIAQAEAGIAQLNEGINELVPYAQAQFKAALAGVYTCYQNTLDYAYDVVATVMQHAAKINTIKVDANSLSGFGSASDALVEYIYNHFVGGATTKFYYELQKNGIQTTGVTEDPVFEMDPGLLADSATAAIAVLAVRYMFGNSFYAHPNIEGHTQIKDAVMAVLVNAGPIAKDYAYDILIKDATTAEYMISEDSYYVGLGDDLSVSDGYVELLAGELGISHKNLAAAGMSMTDLLYILDEDFVADEYTLATFKGNAEELRAQYIAELAKADLVTVGVGSFGITDFVKAQAQGAIAAIFNEQLSLYLNNPMVGGLIREMFAGYGVNLDATTYTMDWVSYIGEDGVAELNGVLADVRDDLITKGIPETFTYDFSTAANEHIGLPLIQAGELVVTVPVADLIVMMAECYMYAYVTHLFNAGEVFRSIHEISPDAQLLVIGMFNPLDEVVLNFGEASISLGEYYTFLVDAMNLRYLTYVYTESGTTFVSIPDTHCTVEENVTNYTDMEQLLMALVLGGSEMGMESEVKPTEEGHKYIKDQIMNALILVEPGLWGDVNGDGVVDINDAWLVQQYDAWIKDEDDLDLSVADVNGDGVVNILDAWLIMQYDAWIIDKFPVEQ